MSLGITARISRINQWTLQQAVAIALCAGALTGLCVNDADARPRVARRASATSTTVNNQELSALPVQRTFFNYNYFNQTRVTLEGGVLAGNTGGDLTGTFSPNVYSGNTTGVQGFLGVDVRTRSPFALPINLDHAQGPALGDVNGDGIPDVIAAPTLGGPVIGVRARFFTSNGNEIPFSIHPPPSTNTLLRYSKNWQVTPYIGLPVIIPDNGNSVFPGPQVVTFWAGPTIVNSTARLRVDEIGNITIFEKTDTRIGIAGGVDFDILLSPKPNGTQTFIRFGAELNIVPGTDLRGRTAFPFDYNVDGDADVFGVFKVGFGTTLPPG